MSAQLVARDLAAGHGARTLFSGLDLVLAPGHVLGVVGPNGAGKSTLLRLLAGLDEPRAGSVVRTPPDATVGLLPQEAERRADEQVATYLARRTGVAAAQAELDAATDDLATGAAGAEDRYAAALERWLSLGAADLDDRAGAVAAQVGLDVDLDQEMTTLSGGQAARAGLAALLLSRFDVLLLDEPTNDLDMEGLELLEDLVRRTDAPIALISHDREFLARTVTEVLELDLHQQQWHLHGGGYEAYLVERERRRAAAQDRYDDYAGTVDALTERARMQRGWADKGARTARRDQSEKDKFIRHHDIATSEQLAAKARRTEKMIERLERVEEPRKEWDLRMSIAEAPPSGRVVAVLDEAQVDRGGFRLGPVSLQIDRGDRIAVTGPNGAGKSTLLGLLLGDVEPDHGAANRGASVQVGEIDQARQLFTDDGTLLDSFCAALPDAPTSEVRTLLAKFGLRGDHVGRPASSASPGERTRAALALLQARGVNLLVLDEPTNHLDLPAIEQLEEALDAYDGTVVLVTHDRRLLERFRSTRHLRLDAGRVVELAVERSGSVAGTHGRR
jgi:ATPase subunit of ABC transporter with duplicated ATPase domains